MKDYLSNLTQPIIKTNTQLICSDHTLKLLLTPNGIIHLKGDKMYDYKIIPTDNSNIIPAFIDKHTLFCAGYRSGKLKDIMQVPVRHARIVMHKRIYKLHNKGKTALVIEKINNIFHDFYFESQYEYDNKFLKKDIISFLLHFK